MGLVPHKYVRATNTEWKESRQFLCLFLCEPLSVERILFVSIYVPGPSWGNFIAPILGWLTGKSRRRQTSCFVHSATSTGPLQLSYLVPPG